MDTSLLYQAGEYFYIGILVYLVLYLLFFAGPLLQYVLGSSFPADIDRLSNLIQQAEQEGLPTATRDGESATSDAIRTQKERSELEEELETTHHELEKARERYAEAKAEGDNATASEIEVDIIPELEEHLEELKQEIDTLEESTSTGDDEDSSVSDMDPDEATARLENLRLLNADYRHPFVKDAVSYLRAKFPRAEYQHFEVEPLPSISEYLEQVSMARNMAGAFVLLGLLGTMIKLDGVVEQIADMAQTSQMKPQQFLGQMGTLMQGVEGAFFNSILGVFLGVFALVIIGLLNRRVQRRIDRLDHVMSQEVLPGLARIHDQLMPERTLADLLRGTGSRIDQLDATVETLQSRMTNTIGTLSDEIEGMLEQFEHYERHYDLINQQVEALDERGEILAEQSERLQEQTEQLANAGERIADPIDEMNTRISEHLEKISELQEDEYLQKILEKMEDTFEAEREARKEQLEDILSNNRIDQENLLQSVRDALAEEQDARSAQVEEMLKQNKQLREAIRDQQDAVQENLEHQHEQITEQLDDTTEALRASTPEKLGKMLEELNNASDRLHDSSKTLSSTAQQLSDQMDRSSTAMRRASESLDRVARAPTFFAWLTQTAWPSVMSGVYSLLGNDKKARQLERRLSRNGHPEASSNQDSSEGSRGSSSRSSDNMGNKTSR